MMTVGMLWLFDRPLAGLVPNLIDAADHFRQKYGRVPDCCMVNLKDLPPTGSPQIAGVRDLGGGKLLVGVVTVRAMKEILPWSLWIGIEEINDGHTNV